MRFLKMFRGSVKFFRKNWIEILLFSLLFLFSWWLMWHTFDWENSQLLIAPKLWSDFGATIPLIRSFSWGDNWPPEFPLFPGEPIRYHFLFHLLVGFLEKAGLPLDWALNLPSIVGFFGLMIMIYFLGRLLFPKKAVAILATTFFLLNGSLAFLEFFYQQPLSKDILAAIANNTTFPSFGPYDGKIVSAFWNLNIYTNQRHLAPAYGGALLIVYLLVRSVKTKKELSVRQIIFLGTVFGLYPFFHKAVFVMIGLLLGWFFLCFPRLRWPLVSIILIGSALALPQITYQLGPQVWQPQGSSSAMITINPGYLVEKPLAPGKIIHYWFFNLGLSLFLIPLGFILAPKLGKKVWLGFLFLFIIGNYFQFSPEIAANHKFFNLFLIGGNLFSAWALYLIWQKNILGKVLAPVLVFFMILSGVIDFFPVKNDISGGGIIDAPLNPTVLWIKENTPRDAVFLNSSFHYHPASLAGRKIFSGWPYFTWSLGYPMNQRGDIFRKIYETRSKGKICQLLIENQIDYFTVEDTLGDPNLPNIDINYFKNNFKAAYSSPKQEFFIYETKTNCLV